MLVTHDGDFLPQLERLCDGRRVGVMAFPEFRNRGFVALADKGVEFFVPGDRREGLQPAPREGHPDRRVRPARLPLTGSSVVGRPGGGSSPAVGPQ
ncbi:MAG: hypothetical protein R2734_03395 [Nocardioides sp.]